MLQCEDDARTGFSLRQHIYREHGEEVTGHLEHIFGPWRRLIECLERLYRIGSGNSATTRVHGRIRSTCWLYSSGGIIVMLDQGWSSFSNTHIVCDWCLQPFVDIDKSFYQRGMFFPINMMNTSYLSHFIRTNEMRGILMTVYIFLRIILVQSVERCQPYWPIVLLYTFTYCGKFGEWWVGRGSGK